MAAPIEYSPLHGLSFHQLFLGPRGFQTYAWLSGSPLVVSFGSYVNIKEVFVEQGHFVHCVTAFSNGNFLMSLWSWRLKLAPRELVHCIGDFFEWIGGGSAGCKLTPKLHMITRATDGLNDLFLTPILFAI